MAVFTDKKNCDTKGRKWETKLQALVQEVVTAVHGSIAVPGALDQRQAKGEVGLGDVTATFVAMVTAFAALHDSWTDPAVPQKMSPVAKRVQGGVWLRMTIDVNVFYSNGDN